MPTLTVTKAGNGSGRVRSTFGGIDCGDTCSTYYFPRAIVDLLAFPDDDSFFAGWSGDGNDVGNVRNVAMGRMDRAVTATFKKGEWKRPDLVVQGLKFVAKSHTVRFRVANIGGSPSAGTAVRVVLRQMLVRGPRSGQMLDSTSDDYDLTSLGPGARRYLSASYTVALNARQEDTGLGIRTLMSVLVIADPDDVVPESSEGNNAQSIMGVLRGSFYVET
jgi:hypothetical protein